MHRVNRGFGEVIAELIAALSAFAAGYVLSLHELYILSGAVIILAAFILSLMHIIKSGVILNPAALFSLFWLGGAGVSSLKLSYLETDWSLASWAAFYLTYAFFIVGYETVGYWAARRSESAFRPPAFDFVQPDAVLSAADIIMAVSLISFVIEVIICGFIPLFTDDTPHAYSYFHVSGLHYFTVSFVLIPALLVIYFFSLPKDRNPGRAERINFLSLFIFSFILPILLVSRFQLVFGTVLAVITFLVIKCPSPRSLFSARCLVLSVSGLIALTAVYIFITYERAHSIEYLNGIFEMKGDFPIFISQPYIYIANNFDNFNALTEGLTGHTYGLRMLYPVFALSGIKFILPGLTSFPLYVTKEELTTLTFIYDAYYDFGIYGVAMLSLITGAAASFTEHKIFCADEASPVGILIYAQIIFYIIFSFFTTWFSNPATWFYFLVCLAIGIYLKLYKLFKRV